MHLLIVADGRSPIARNWITGELSLGHRVSLVSTYPCSALPGVTDLIVMPVAFGGMAGGGQGGRRSGFRQVVGRFRPVFQAGRSLLGPLLLLGSRRRFARLAAALQPDLVHALRIPYEGMLASLTPAGLPFVVSVWGNDLTLHAPESALLGRLTRQTLRRADGLLADAQRDLHLAQQWGFDPARPARVIPGGGGVDLAEIRVLAELGQAAAAFDFPPEAPLIINPRGIRAYARADTFFQAIPLVLQRWPSAHFLCPGMAGQPEALRWMSSLKLDDRVHLLPVLPQAQLWGLFLRAMATVSLTSHDGTPNTLIEAMACGCLPVAGDVAALREWITPGVNGLLVDPDNPQSLAEALVLALNNPPLRKRAAEINLDLVTRRAELQYSRAQMQVFYQQLVAAATTPGV
ncbi:MAG TPA: glycosyltransferase family 4 protein [Anaerolineaceae bacterium]|nr:glycosyltransferase family 4 protein [Anaerolineaceae bacterium]